MLNPVKMPLLFTIMVTVECVSSALKVRKEVWWSLQSCKEHLVKISKEIYILKCFIAPKNPLHVTQYDYNIIFFEIDTSKNNWRKD